MFARRVKKLEELAAEVIAAGGRVLVVPGDVTQVGFADEVCRRAVEAFGAVDILVNNAGIADHLMATVRTTDEVWAENIAVNQTAPFRFCRAALRYMTEKGTGVIVNVSSIGGVYSIAGASYSSSKRGLLGLTKNISVQYAGTGIRCNAVCPGATDTDMLKDSGRLDEQMMEMSGRRVDLSGGISEAIDMANTILFLSARRIKIYQRTGHCRRQGLLLIRRSGMDRMKGKYAVITGGNSGIGAAVARLFADEGAAGIAIIDLKKGRG